MEHDFKKYPELTNKQLAMYIQSPHKQITEDFRAIVTKVHDGDTITVRTDFRDFDFPIRFLGTNAKEMGEGGAEARDFLKGLILGEEVEVLIDRHQRVGKYGRLLGVIVSKGMRINDIMINLGFSTTFEERNKGKLPVLNKELNLRRWL